MKADADIAVVGAGVVGLATAVELQRAGHSVVVLERNPQPGQEQSTHNSGVVHSGAFVRPGTLRARLCVEGNALIRRRAERGDFRIRVTGTLAVALSQPQKAKVDQYADWGRANGVPGVQLLDTAEVRKFEPEIAPTVGGLLLPTGARVDAAGFVRALALEAAALGAGIRTGWSLVAAGWASQAWTLGSSEGESLRVRAVVNAAGVESAMVADLLGVPGYRIYPCLGEYARVLGARRSTIRSMVYSIPSPGYPGIGVHLTRTVDDQLILGPTARYLETPAPPPGPITTLEEFAAEGAALLPGLRADELEVWPSGVRAKPVPPGSTDAFGDFTVDQRPPGRHVVQLVGIESPGLTASLALARYVSTLPALTGLGRG
jgi:glycerol-3-phosphate dehydrogenase